MKYSYKTQGTCSQAITFDLDDGIVTNVQFYGGCNGNTQGVAKLVDGMKAEDIIAKAYNADSKALPAPTS